MAALNPTKKGTIFERRGNPAMRLLEAAEFGDLSAHWRVIQLYERSVLARRLLRQLEPMVVAALLSLMASEAGLQVLGYGRARGRPPSGISRQQQVERWVFDLLEDQRVHGELKPENQRQLRRYLSGVMQSEAKRKKFQAALFGRGKQGRMTQIDPFTSNVELGVAVLERLTRGLGPVEACREAARELKRPFNTVRNRYREFQATEEVTRILAEASELSQGSRIAATDAGASSTANLTLQIAKLRRPVSHTCTRGGYVKLKDPSRRHAKAVRTWSRRS